MPTFTSFGLALPEAPGDNLGLRPCGKPPPPPLKRGVFLKAIFVLIVVLVLHARKTVREQLRAEVKVPTLLKPYRSGCRMRVISKPLFRPTTVELRDGRKECPVFAPSG